MRRPRAYLRIERGASTGIELDPSSSPAAVQEIVVQAEHEVRVRFRDGSEPLSGFTADLYEPSLGFSIAPGQPDAEGLASWHNLSDQSYEVRVDAPGFWPLAASVQATRSGPASPIQMRRVGNALLQFERPEEVTSLELLSVEYGDDVVGWLADGRIRSSTGSLAAGPDGRVALEGLPRGSYRWEMTFDSVSKSGEFVVPAHGTATVELP